MSSVEIPNSTELNAMSRADLDALAEELGLDPEDYSNRTLEIQAIKDQRSGDTPEVIAATDAAVEAEAVDGGYPPYLPITPGQREPGQDDPAAAVTTLTKVPDGDVRWGDEVYFLTPDVFPNTKLRVKVVMDAADSPDGVAHELFSLDQPCGGGATPMFQIGPTSLWTEHSSVHGTGTATIINEDPDHGGETEEESITFAVFALQGEVPVVAEEVVPWEQREIPVLGSDETIIFSEQVAAANEEAAQQPA